MELLTASRLRRPAEFMTRFRYGLVADAPEISDVHPSAVFAGEYDDCMLPSGLLNVSEQIREMAMMPLPDILREVAPVARFVVAGHSIGGTLAQVVLGELTLQDLALFTYDQCKVLKQLCADHVDKLAGTSHMRFGVPG